MNDKRFTKEDFEKWLENNKITVKQLSDIIETSRSLLDKYLDGSATIPIRFRYTLDGVLLERITKAKEGLRHD